MSGIFGVCYHDGGVVDLASVRKMQAAMSDWGRDGQNLCLEGSAAFGQLRSFTTPEAHLESLPRRDPDSGVVFTAAGRVDNREELGRALDIPLEEQSHLADGDFLFRAYQRWGEASPVRIYGDWAFAVWYAAERSLFLARDHHGNTALYYHATPTAFAFSSSCQALLALKLTPIEMDELYLAQVLVSWAGYYGERTIHKPIRRLPPAHCLTARPGGLDVRQYWRLENTPELRLRNRADYVDAFREVFDEAVRVRLRSVGNIGVALSGGLDSGSVAATAAPFLQAQGKRLWAFTSVPVSDTSRYVGNHIGDEFALAQATARFAGGVDLVPVAAASTTPIEGIRRLLKVHNEPAHSAGNSYWILEIRSTARAHGCRVLLTGQLGNAGMSWSGEPLSQPLGFQLRSLGWRRWTKERLKQVAPPGILSAWHRTRRWGNRRSYRSAAIHPEFARRLDSSEHNLRTRWNQVFTEALARHLEPALAS